MGRCLPDVLAAVGLRIEPADLARIEAHVPALPTLPDETAIERGERVHHAVGMSMRARRLSGLVPVLQDTDAVVLEDDLVLVGISVRRILHTQVLSIGCRRQGVRSRTT